MRVMCRSLKITNKPGRLEAAFLVTKKPAPGTKKPGTNKPGTKKPGNKYKYVQSIAANYRGEGCVGIKTKYSYCKYTCIGAFSYYVRWKI